MSTRRWRTTAEIAATWAVLATGVAVYQGCERERESDGAATWSVRALKSLSKATNERDWCAGNLAVKVEIAAMECRTHYRVRWPAGLELPDPYLPPDRLLRP